jgi:rare lipoprotein A (peptidoglycan hydrolase)
VNERAAQAAATAGATALLALPLVAAGTAADDEPTAGRAPDPAHATSASPDVSRAERAERGRRTTASAYGPGLYGNHLACGGRLWPGTVGIAHRSLPCGTRLRICWRRRCARARVRDRGPYIDGRELDLTEALVRRLGVRSATAWGVRFIHYEEVGR